MRNVFRKFAALVGIAAGIAGVAQLGFYLRDNGNKIAEQDLQKTVVALQTALDTSMTPKPDVTIVENDPSQASTATAQAFEMRSTQTAIVENLQNIYATQTVVAEAFPTPYLSDTSLPNMLVECDYRLTKGISKTVQPNTFIVGDVYVNETKQFDNGTAEGTVVFFESQGSVRAPYGAGCYTGPFRQLDTIVRQLRVSGCQSGCKTIRVVVVKDDGTQAVEYK